MTSIEQQPSWAAIDLEARGPWILVCIQTVLQYYILRKLTDYLYMWSDNEKNVLPFKYIGKFLSSFIKLSLVNLFEGALHFWWPECFAYKSVCSLLEETEGVGEGLFI